VPAKRDKVLDLAVSPVPVGMMDDQVQLPAAPFASVFPETAIVDRTSAVNPV
jgi:hypothetical protein